MKIAIIGYGKMGKEIEKVLHSRNHDVVAVIDDPGDLEKVSTAEAAIDFSVPSAAVSNMEFCFRNNIPVVQGTTGWYDDFDEVREACKTTGGSLLYATNFSIGVNIFFMVNEFLAGLMNEQADYKVEVFESHHTQKLDAPSGTALTLTEGILDKISKKNNWKKFKEGKTPDDLDQGIIPVEYSRVEGVVGFHKVTYTSAIDEIKISHEAFSRKGFAQGAVIAAEWLVKKQGVFTMRDLINDLKNN